MDSKHLIARCRAEEKEEIEKACKARGLKLGDAVRLGTRQYLGLGLDIPPYERGRPAKESA